MQIRWFGECSFLLQDSLGRRIITDPFDLYPIDYFLNFNPKIITISHKYTEYFSKNLENNNCNIINNAGFYNLDFSNIEGIPSFHDKVHGAKRGYNIIYKFNFDGLTLCHLGHLGHLLSDNIINSLKNIDILFVPIGGHLTLNGLEAATLCRIINPKIVIPMYYKTNNINPFLDSPKTFITSMKYITNIKDYILDTDDISINKNLHTLILKQSNIN